MSKAAHRQEVKEYISRMKCAPCSDCRIQYNPWIMEFDHRDPKTKKFLISQAIRGGYTLDKVQAEIDKCDLVCSNCHAERTHKLQVQYGRYLERLKPNARWALGY